METIASFFVAMMLILSPAFAQIKYSGINVDVDDRGKSFVEMTLTLSETVVGLNINIVGHAQNLKASTDIGLINCDLKRDGTSSISCKSNITERSIVRLSFETNDFIKQIGNESYLSIKMGFDESIEHSVFSIKLPDGAVIKSFYPEKPRFSTDVFIVWSFLNILENEPLEFEVTYEYDTSVPIVPTPEVFPWENIWKYILIGVVTIAGAILFILKRIRKPSEVIISVLDEYEKKVINIINAAGGEVNQKKVVQETNLSKAKVSRVVKSLQNRGLITVERLGRTNKLRLVKKKFEF